MLVVICNENEEDALRTSYFLETIAEKQNEKVSVKIFGSYSKMLFAFEDIASQIDIIYMDVITLGSVSGKELSQRLLEDACGAEIVFTADADDRWPEGYDAGAFHFLVKNESGAQKFNEVFLRLSERIKTKKREVVAFTYAGEKVIVPVSEIQYFQSNGRMITVHYGDKQLFEFYSRMNKIENSLINEGFLRIHKSYIVNRAYAVGVKTNTIMLLNGEELPLSRSFAPTVRASFPESQLSGIN